MCDNYYHGLGKSESFAGLLLVSECVNLITTVKLFQYACRVIATCRDPANSNNLQQLHKLHKGALDIVRLDVTEEESIQACLP